MLAFERRPDAAGVRGGITDSAVAAVESAGGTISSQGEFGPGLPYAFVRDPDGYEIEICSNRHVILQLQSKTSKERRMTQIPDRADFRPAGWHTVTPRIVAHGAETLVAFIKEVFAATGGYQLDRPAELRIGDSIVMISDAGVREAMPAFLYVYVESADLTWQLAVKAGAQSLEAPSNTPYGDRRAMVKDRWGNTWQIATRMRTNPPAVQSPYAK
jgi:PhnB protein